MAKFMAFLAAKEKKTFRKVTKMTYKQYKMKF